MTYEQYLRRSIKLQLEYITTERGRMVSAQALLDKAGGDHGRRDYADGMRHIRLHPLSQAEITARVAELRDMAERVNETHGDCEGQRAMYESRLWEKSVSRG